MGRSFGCGLDRCNSGGFAGGGGGLISSFIALDYVTLQGGIADGVNYIYHNAGDKLHMILSRNHPQFMNLLGMGAIIGGMWVANLYYFGPNQYIIQRALAAKSLREAQKRLAFAAFLKLLFPFLVVIPGIIAWVMYMQPERTVVAIVVKQAFAQPGGGINYDLTYP